MMHFIAKADSYLQKWWAGKLSHKSNRKEKKKTAIKGSKFEFSCPFREWDKMKQSGGKGAAGKNTIRKSMSRSEIRAAAFVMQIW